MTLAKHRQKRRPSGASAAEPVTFVVRAENRAHVLARVVLLFHKLHAEIDALWMVRSQDSETMRMDVTIRADHSHAKRVEAELYKVVEVRSVETQRPRRNARDERQPHKASA